MSEERKHIDIAEFRDFGYLQEVNRQFFHPLGLALMIREEHCPDCVGFGRRAPRFRGDEQPHCTTCKGSGRIDCLDGVWETEDPEGMMYAEDLLDAEKAERVRSEAERMAAKRQESLGWVVQPVPGEEAES